MFDPLPIFTTSNTTVASNAHKDRRYALNKGMSKAAGIGKPMSLKNSYLALLFLSLAACGGGGDDTDNNPGPYTITFSLDDSFQIPHGGEPIRIALVRLSDGLVIAEDFGTVSATQNPSFSFTTSAIMERAKSYAVHYWIDSNLGGGTLGLCDGTDYDHQWSTEFFSVTNDINFTAGYQPGLVEYVCNTFP